MQEGVGHPGFSIGDRLINVHRHNTNRAHLGSAGEPEAISGTGNGIGCRQRRFIGHGPEGFGGGLCQLPQSLRQIEHATRLATAGVDLQQHRLDHRVGKSRFSHGLDVVVAGEATGGTNIGRATHQGAQDREYGDAFHNLEATIYARIGRGWRWRVKGVARELSGHHPEDHFELRARNEQWRPV